MNNSTGHDTSAKPTGQGYGAARKGPGVRGPIEAQVKEEPKEEEPTGPTEVELLAEIRDSLKK